MREYTPQIQISADDPVCSTSSLEGTVIGILFDKKGSEIKDAITTRLDLIDNKITEYSSVAEKTETFIEEKRNILKDLDILHQNRLDEKKAFLQPFKRDIEDIVKKAEEKVFKYDKDTYKKLSEQAVIFEEGFDGFKENFDDLDDFLDKEKDIIRNVEICRGFIGVQGDTGVRGEAGSLGDQGPISGSGNIGMGMTSPEEILELVSEDEDRAIARLRTLRSLLNKNVCKLHDLQIGIKGLKDEKRRLILISTHLDDNRLYKLDLNKLSAFGFEDVETE